MSKLYLILFMFLSCDAYAATDSTSRITGQVFDNQSHPLERAYVEIFQGKKCITSTLTDFNGLYEVSKLKPGRYDIFISHSVYKTLATKEVITNPNRATRVNAKLELQVEETLITMPHP